MELEKDYQEHDSLMTQPSDDEGQNTIHGDVEMPNQQLAACKAEVTLWKEKYLRATADFQNFTKRMEKEQAEWMRTAQIHVLKDVLPLVDDLERACADIRAKEQQGVDVTALLAALSMITAATTKMLSKYNVKEITENTLFNPNVHEALMSVASPDHTSGQIVAVLQKGYMIHDQVLRPAKVSVVA